MGAMIIQVAYEQLDTISGRFGAAADVIAELGGRVGRATQQLERSWLGDSATAFFAEMEHDVRPALVRLNDVFSEAQRVSQEIRRLMGAAEREAAALFDDWYDMGRIGPGGISGGRDLQAGVKAKTTLSHGMEQTPTDADPTPAPGTPTPTPKPEIVSRDDWGARAPNFESVKEGRYDPATNTDGYAYYSELQPGATLADSLDTVVIHHAGNTNDKTVKSVQDLHMDVEQWADIGYHYIIGPDGTIYEGRDITARGSHVAGANTGKVGILILGDFEPGPSPGFYDHGFEWDRDGDNEPTPAQLESAAALIGWLDSSYGIDNVFGHNHFNPTECPGDLLEEHLEDLNAVAQER
ncbi:MAG TPA: WXG100 family type VII secretion target [Herpetosiphonaceae bacterium]